MTAPKEECIEVRPRPADIRRRIAERDPDGDIMAILADAGDRFNVTIDEILAYGRDKATVMARDQVFATIYELGHWSTPRLGMLFGRDHTTVLDGIKRHMRRLGQP